MVSAKYDANQGKATLTARGRIQGLSALRLSCFCFVGVFPACKLRVELGGGFWNNCLRTTWGCYE